MSKNLDIAIKAAILAGKKILEVYNDKQFDVKIKEDNTPLTIADELSHKIITTNLISTEIPILSEEGKNIPYDERKQWNEYWLVDPLDGTKEFIKRNGEFTVNIALINDGTPVLGVIYVPVTKDLYFSEKDLGAFKAVNVDLDSDINLTKQFSFKMPLSIENDVFTVVGSRSHMNKETDDFIAKLKQENGELSFISKGSSLKICMVAEGIADIYPRFAPTMEWDTGAGHAIAIAAGCSVTQDDEITSVIYNKENLLNPWFIVKR